MTLRCVRGALRPSCASPPRPAHARRSASAPRTCPHFFPFGSRNQSDQFVSLKYWGPTGGRAGESGTQCVWAGGRPAGISGGRFRLGVSKAPRGTPSARARARSQPRSLVRVSRRRLRGPKRWRSGTPGMVPGRGRRPDSPPASLTAQRQNSLQVPEHIPRRRRRGIEHSFVYNERLLK